MGDRVPSVSLSICVAVLLAAVASALAEGEAGPPEAPARSAIWGWWPVLPWDAQAVGDSSLGSVLDQPINLARRGKVGDQHRYQVKRVNLTVDREGKVVSRVTAEADLARTLVREAEPGLWIEQCEWERFAAAQAMTPNDYPTPQELPSARGIAFEFSPRTFDYVNAPADFARVGDEMAGYLLKVLTMDAMGWDAILLALRDEFKEGIHIGDTWRQTSWEPWDISRVGAEGSVGQYHAGEMQVSVAGLTRLQGQPCALIWFSMEGNKVTQKLDNPMFSMDMGATEYFRGELSVSLLDGHVVGMELTGPLPCVMKMGFGGQPPAEQPIGAIIQQVSMWEIPATERPGSAAH